ncbi:hypothetical protein BJ742DRAFT_780104 [Cladochytrium replicatum]|nr:hypothetical protein BJ742DRAFT_780104 [Cladochytrium replicatum]
MAPTTAPKTKTAAHKKKSAGGGSKKLSAFQKYVSKEIKRMKEDNPNKDAKEIFAEAVKSWKDSPQNPKNSK